MVPEGGVVGLAWWCWYVRCFCWVQSPLFFGDGRGGNHLFAWCWRLFLHLVGRLKVWRWKDRAKQFTVVSTFGFENLCRVFLSQCVSSWSFTKSMVVTVVTIFILQPSPPSTHLIHILYLWLVSPSTPSHRGFFEVYGYGENHGSRWCWYPCSKFHAGNSPTDLRRGRPNEGEGGSFQAWYFSWWSAKGSKLTQL